MAVVKSSLKGYDELIARLRTISDAKVIRKNGRKASKVALTPMYRDVKDRARMLDRPITPHQRIWRNISLRNRRNRSDSVGARIGVRGGAKKGQGVGLAGGDTFYWRFLEFGTRHARAKPFMRPAFNTNVKSAEKNFAVEFNKLLKASGGVK